MLRLHLNLSSTPMRTNYARFDGRKRRRQRPSASRDAARRLLAY
jgi:hypothetical protein